MKRILKYPIKEGANTIKLPPLSYPLTVQMQNGKSYVWILVDDYYPELGDWNFYVFATGEEISQRLKKDQYVRTFQMEQGSLIWHLFAERLIN